LAEKELIAEKDSRIADLQNMGIIG